jgi:hypothetical protein
MPPVNEIRNTSNPMAATRSDSPDLKTEIDPTAPAGSKNSLGAESVRDGRPSTDDEVVEAMDEEDPEETISGMDD